MYIWYICTYIFLYSSFWLLLYTYYIPIHGGVSKHPLAYETCKLQGSHTHTHTHIRWMNNYHDMQTHKSREHKNKKKFHYILWFTTPSTNCPVNLPHPLALHTHSATTSYVYEFTFLARDPSGCTGGGVDIRAKLKRRWVTDPIWGSLSLSSSLSFALALCLFSFSHNYVEKRYENNDKMLKM